MQLVINNKLTAPGRMDIVERVLQNDQFFKEKMSSTPGRFGMKNRRGVRKQYSGLTVGLVMHLAKIGQDAARMGRDEIIAKAFEYCEPNGQHAVAA